MAGLGIILSNGTFGVLAGSTIFSFPDDFDWNKVIDETDVNILLEEGELEAVATVAP